MKKFLLALLVSTQCYAIDVRPVDDSSAFCDKVDCIVSITYMDRMGQFAMTQQAIIDKYAAENRELRAALEGKKKIAPIEIPSAEWSFRMSQERHIAMDAFAKRNRELEAKCADK